MTEQSVSNTEHSQNEAKVILFQSKDELIAFGKCVAEHWRNRIPLPLIDPKLSMTDALIIRDSFLECLRNDMGDPAGYKVAAITPPAQRDLGIKEPLGAVYLEGMFSEAGGEAVPVDYGARPIVEAKMMVLVGSHAINEAQSPVDVAQAISHLNPSLELGDSLAHPDQLITGALLTVYDVGARSILTGTPIPFDGSADAILRFESMVVSTIDVGSGEELDKHSAEVMMGSPLNAIYWIVEHHRKQGVIFKPGDRLGLGAMSRVRPVAGQNIKTVWEGLLQESIEVGVQFS